MRITFVLPGVFIGGGVRVIFEYANRLRERGHLINVVHPLVPVCLKPRITTKDIRSQISGIYYNYKAGKPRWMELNTNLLMIPTMNPRYAKYVQELIPDSDIIVATSWETAYFVSKLSQKKGKKYYFVQSYEIWDIWENEACWEKIQKIEDDPSKWQIKMSYLMPKSSYLSRSKELVDNTYTLPDLKKITIASWLEELLKIRFDQVVEGMITNGVNFNEFYCEDISGKLTNENTSDSITILSSIRGGSVLKGDFDLIKALGIINARHPEVNIKIYGSKENIEIPEYVNFIHKPYGEILRKTYCSAQIFISASRLEGFGLPPMEAMACGCAVVATNVGGIPDYSINEKTAVHVSPNDPEKLAASVIRLIENHEERINIAKNGYHHIKQFTLDKATDKLELIFRSAYDEK